MSSKFHSVALEALLLGQLFIFWTIFDPQVLYSSMLASQEGFFIQNPPINFYKHTLYCGKLKTFSEAHNTFVAKQIQAG